MSVVVQTVINNSTMLKFKHHKNNIGLKGTSFLWTIGDT